MNVSKSTCKLKPIKKKNERDYTEIDTKELRKRRRIERDPLHQGLILERSKLQARGFRLNLQALLGKTQVIGNTTALSQQAGYYCSVCECVLKDSITYLDHINGKWHQRALGISMRVEKVGADKVRARINSIKKKTRA
jgi:U4/U6.U5 tri-snRNP component SNU23